MKKTSISQEKIPSRANFAGQSLTRRRFFRSAAGTGAGLVLGSTITRPLLPVRADAKDRQGCLSHGERLASEIGHAKA